MGEIPQRRSTQPNHIFCYRLAKGLSAAAELRRKYCVSQVLKKVVKTLEPVGDISLYRKHNKHVHSFPASLVLPPFPVILLFLILSSFPHPHHPSLFIFLHTSLLPSFRLLFYLPLVLSSSSPSSSSTQGSRSASSVFVCAESLGKYGA